MPPANAPWQCVRTEPQPTGNAQELADGLAERIVRPGVQCDPPTGTDGSPDRYVDYFVNKTRPIDPTDPRFVTVFVVPFGSLKGSPDGAVPILDIASFYVTDWAAPGGAAGDPCEPDANGSDQTTIPGRVAGYFVSTVGPNTGPTEPEILTAPEANNCNHAALRPCRAVLVR